MRSVRLVLIAGAALFGYAVISQMPVRAQEPVIGDSPAVRAKEETARILGLADSPAWVAWRAKVAQCDADKQQMAVAQSPACRDVQSALQRQAADDREMASSRRELEIAKMKRDLAASGALCDPSHPCPH